MSFVGPPPCLDVLVVENHADLRAALAVFLEQLGHRARFASDCAGGLQAAQEQLFDVLLSDISLPDGDGWDLLHDLDMIGRRPKLAIAMSGFGSAADIAKSAAAGFHDHLVKPFQPAALEAALVTALRPARPA